ncbi:hypothetical protein KSS87_019726 [Heliosperma pusillum]|nr:hypothetical protein KSS87_019726 [Heliosperma pusillum]
MLKLLSSKRCNLFKSSYFLHPSNPSKSHLFHPQFDISSSGSSPKSSYFVNKPLISTNDRVLASGYLSKCKIRGGFLRNVSMVGERRGFCGVSDRETMEYDVVIVGAGPAGLSAAIRLKQLCIEKDVDMSVCAHILSGNVFEPRALDELIPDWKQEQAPINTPVSSDKFWLLTKDRALSLPSPFDNQGNYVISLHHILTHPSHATTTPVVPPKTPTVPHSHHQPPIAINILTKLPTTINGSVRNGEYTGDSLSHSLSQLVRWMGTKAEELGVEIYPGFAASEDELPFLQKAVEDHYQRFKIIKNYKLREKGNAQHQTYALGIKEVWEIDIDKHQPGFVLHTLGWPLDYRTYGGSFMYHMKDNLVSIGLVVALNYQNPFLNPYEEFQKLKQHPAIRPMLEGGSIIQYGARTLNEGGFQSIPYPVFPGGAILGCSAGFLNVPKIKGTHTAMKSGMLAAESAFGLLHQGLMMESYWDNLQNSWIWEELYKARNFRPAFDYGLIPGLTLSALEHYIMMGRSPWTLKHGKPDHVATNVANRHSPIQYPKPDGVISFDVPTSLYRSNTNHDHDQPSHLRLKDPLIPNQVNLPEYAGPESRYCPARVYEYLPDDNGEMKLQINAQNCLHCKACDIKDPKQNIEWTVPEGGGGPGYTGMKGKPVAINQGQASCHQQAQAKLLGAELAPLELAAAVEKAAFLV